MTEITLQNLRHSYLPKPSKPADWALKELNLSWSSGGAYALLGPSGCGKTTLLNIISGLIHPTEGRVLFGGRDVTEVPPDHRNIAQVFQFPVVYDTMTVGDNLSFPLRNRGIPQDEINRRIHEIAAMLDLENMLSQRASGLTADGKQKISLGRGLVRSDVNVIMFDEPLTVIDPHLKWRLRSKLKELHQRIGVTMIYVTHDQTEALTFADKVVVMHDGQAVQVGTPVELFEKPQHTFVGHFIGSPGMNVLPCELREGRVFFAGECVPMKHEASTVHNGGRLELGVRPEFVQVSRDEGIPVQVVKVSDAGRYRIVEAHADDTRINMLINEGEDLPTDGIRVQFDPMHTRLYADGWLVE